MSVNLLSVLRSKPSRKSFLRSACTIFIEDRRHLTKQIKQAYLILFRFALSFQKIAGASDEKIEQALFSSLGLHYLCIQNINKEKC